MRSSARLPAAGIYHGNLDYESNSDDLIDGAQLLPYPAQTTSPSLSPTRQNVIANSAPISMSLTEFHFLLLYRDRVLGISNLNEQLAYEELLPLVRSVPRASSFLYAEWGIQKPNEQARGLTADPIRKTYWVYTDQSIWEINVTNEHRDVWKIYLENGQYDAALQYAKVSA